MAQLSRGRLRRFWFDVHMWIGVGLFLVLVPLSVSGSYLVWHDEIDRAAHPARFAVTADQARLPSSAYLSSAQAAFGERADAASIRLPQQVGDPVVVTGPVRRPPAAEAPGAAAPRPQGRPRTLTAWVDPGTAKVLEVADVRQGFSMWMHDLHGQLFVPPMGRKIVGWLGWLMAVSCFTGIWLWWPKAGALKNAFRWRRSPSTLLNLHYLTGFWIAIPLAVLSVSGALISFPQFSRSLIKPFAPVNAQVQRGPPGGQGGRPVSRTQMTPDQAAGVALQAAPGAALVSVTLPTRSRDGVGDWRVQLRQPGAEAASTFMVKDGGGEARLQPQAKPLAGEQLLRLNRRIHDGGETPLLWKLIITIAGLIPALLGVTGVVIWARGQLRKASMRRRLAEPAGQPEPAE